MKRDFVVALFVGLGVLATGCTSGGDGVGGSGTSSARSQNPAIAGGVASSQDNAPTIHFYVIGLTRPDNTGNAYVTEEYARNLLTQVEETSSHVVAMSLSGFARIPDAQFDEPRQGSVFNRYKKDWSVPGFVTIVIPQPYTTDGDGMSEQYGAADPNTSAFILVRSRNPFREKCGCGSWGIPVALPVGERDDLIEVSMMTLHEVGHNGGLFHESGFFPGYPDLNTDNYWRLNPGAVLLPFAQALAERRAR